MLAAADADPGVMRAYVVVSLLTGARTEELRALTWSHVDLGESGPATLSLWRSVRAGGDTKTKRSRRTLELPSRCVEALRAHRMAQLQDRLAAGERWVDLDLVFTTERGNGAGCGECSSGFPPGAGGGRPRRVGVDTTRASALVRVAAVGVGDGDRGHLAPAWATQVRG